MLQIPEIGAGLPGDLVRKQTLPGATTEDDSEEGDCMTLNHLSSSWLTYNKWLVSHMCIHAEDYKSSYAGQPSPVDDVNSDNIALNTLSKLYSCPPQERSLV